MQTAKKVSPYGTKKIKTIDEYHASFPKNVRSILSELKKTIIKAAPGAEEVISYNMPAFKQNGMLVYYAAYKKHIGFYPTSTPIIFFKEELLTYKSSKGAIQFPLDKPLPLKLVTKIVKFKIKENREKELTRKQKSYSQKKSK